MSCAALGLFASAVGAQARIEFSAPTAFHAAPDGVLLGELQPSASFSRGPLDGTWRQVTLEAWVFTASISAVNEGGFSHRITAAGGENLRDGPNGGLVARALEGVYLTRVATQGGWSRVRRTVWVQEAAQIAATPTASRPAAAPPPPPPPPPPPEVAVVQGGASLATGPGAPAIGPAPEGMRVEIVSRSGGWVKVRTDLWVREGDLAPAPVGGGTLTLAQLLTEPESHIGSRVTWRLQFLAIDTADELRPELPFGEPYLLTRGPLPEAGFVYVALTSSQAERFRGMEPLEEFQATGTVLAARTRYLPVPVIRLEGSP